MIIDLVLLLFQSFLEILLLPLTGLNIVIDIVGSIPVVQEFLQIVTYVLPWDNLVPIFAIIFGVFIFRAVLALINLIWHFIPIFGN